MELARPESCNDTGKWNGCRLQHSHRWQNRDVAFLMHHALSKRRRWRKGVDIVQNKVCIWLCFCTAEKERLFHLQRDFTSIVMRLDQCWNQTSLQGIRSSDSMAVETTFCFTLIICHMKHGWRLKLKEPTSFCTLIYLFYPFLLSLCHWNNPL